MPCQKSWVKAKCAKCLISFTNLLHVQFIPSDTFKTLFSASKDCHILYLFQSEWELKICASPEPKHWGQPAPVVLCDWILNQHGWGCLLSIDIPKIVFQYYFRYKGNLKMSDSPIEPCCWDGVEWWTVGWDQVPNLVAGEASWYHWAIIREICNKTVIIMTLVCQYSLPTTLRKFWFLAVWKSGASPDTSHR